MTIEIVMHIRDKDGNPISKRSHLSDKAGDISNFWENNRLHKKYKRNKRKDAGVASTSEASTILANMNEESGEESD